MSDSRRSPTTAPRWLVNVALGHHVPPDPTFSPAPMRPLSRAYRNERRHFVHARVCRDHAGGKCLLLNERAAAVVRREPGVNDCPVGSEPTAVLPGF